MKIIQVVGARPQFIKYYPVLEAIREHAMLGGPEIQDVLVHTGQHYDYAMSKVFFDELGIPEPHYHLGVGSASHATQTADILQKIEQIVLSEKPDCVVVYGDTNSTLGAALATVKLHVPLAHVEAGLRSFRKEMPEEVNRILTDHSSTVLFCPTEIAVQNLKNEGIGLSLNGRTNLGISVDNPAVLNVGDVMYDVVLLASKLSSERSTILERLSLHSKGYLLMTLHRAENTDDKEQFCQLVAFVNQIAAGEKVILPMHPRTKKIYEQSPARFADNVIIIDPVGYFDILKLLCNAECVLTDSGGMQKEAFWMKVPCITLRDETEWLETIQSGWNVLYRNYHGFHMPSDSLHTAYGDGRASRKIVSSLIELLGGYS
ncbi:MAG: non-hydrolyzing UDP-N-acetylglucosamine 2-epimerase [Dissulfurispiraceae bacterium]